MVCCGYGRDVRGSRLLPKEDRIRENSGNHSFIKHSWTAPFRWEEVPELVVLWIMLGKALFF